MNKKQKSLNNKGFSLVELIIVIAIMAVLVGVLAPQFLGYVKKSRVSTDIQNAQQIASAVAVQIADDESTGSTTTGFAIPATGALTTVGSSNWPTAQLGTIPSVKVSVSGSTLSFKYTIDPNSSVKVYITDGTNDVELYPSTPASSATGFAANWVNN